jgi:uncharacterized protein (UPF0276 family)
MVSAGMNVLVKQEIDRAQSLLSSASSMAEDARLSIAKIKGKATEAGPEMASDEAMSQVAQALTFLRRASDNMKRVKNNI